VYNRSYDKTEAAVARAKKEGLGDKLHGYKDVADFVASLQKPRRVIILVKAGAPVDGTIDALMQHMEPGDIIIDGGNEWCGNARADRFCGCGPEREARVFFYQPTKTNNPTKPPNKKRYANTERRKAQVEAKGLRYMGMGVSGGEEGARNGPALMPGGSPEAYGFIENIVSKVAAQVDDGPCVMYVGDGGAGNYVKMVHNGIEYGDMQLIAEAYDVLRVLGGLTNDELAATFKEWNAGELQSFLVEISAIILAKRDDNPAGKKDGYIIDRIVDKTGSKGTGKWTVQEAAELGVAAPTIAASLDGRYMSALKDERTAAAALFSKLGLKAPAPPAGQPVDKKALVDDVRQALYCSKICSYAQGMNIIKAKSEEKGWGVDLGGLARIWKGGCIIRAAFLDRIKQAYRRDAALPSLLVDPPFAEDLAKREQAWRRVVALAVSNVRLCLLLGGGGDDDWG
jgi:6-phosphogluconate dehydrogenase